MQLNFGFSVGRGLSRWMKCALASLALVSAPVAGTAQNLFAPAIIVNDDVITNYELGQRARFMALLRAPGNPEEEAREALIEDRLRAQILEEFDVVVTPEQLEQGMSDFAARTQMTTQEFLGALAQGGVEPETLREFVRINLGWREYIRGRYGEQARPSPAEIDRALANNPSSGSVSVLLSEVIIPFTPDNLPQVEQLANEIAGLNSYDAFSQAASQYSASETRNSGGRLDWLPINNLPEQLRPVIMELNPGETTQPIPLPNAVAIFQMRGIQEIPGGTPSYSSIDYATYMVPGGRSAEAQAAAASVLAQVDRCDDFYGLPGIETPGVFQRQSQAPGAIPRDIALELAKLDQNETSTALTRSNGQTLVVLMLCGRTAAVNEDATRDDIGNFLTQQRLQSYADSALAQRRADALIVEK
ncbi:MAG: peptidylprolyl isomerase [Heliomarina sp.]|uniref:peptidylprolyl isomerase n=1 Tax=Heliomarina sp. TaxID=2917556 RepID=UPI004058EF14